MDSVADRPLNSRSVFELKQVCKSFGLNTTGRKGELIDRVNSFLSSNSPKQKTCTTNNFRPPPIHTPNNCAQAENFRPRPKARATTVVSTKLPDSLISKHIPNSKKCYCLESEKLGNDSAEIIKCILCSGENHRACVKYQGSDSEYKCPHCKLFFLDPFFVPEKVFHVGRATQNHILNRTLTEEEKNNCLNAVVYIPTEELKIWRNNQRHIVVRCVEAGEPNFFMSWPRTFSIRTSEHTETIAAPTWEHKRRETPLVITHFLKAGSTNKLQISGTNYENDPKLFIFGVFLCRAIEKDSLKASIIGTAVTGYGILNYERARTNLVDLITKSGNDMDDDVKCMEANRRIKITDPVSLLRLETPIRGMKCKHLQCFSLETFIDVTFSTRAFNSRWKCPECHLFVRPEELVVDLFIMYILKQTKEEDKVIEFESDGSWRVVHSEELRREKEEAESHKNVSFTPKTSEKPIMDIPDESAKVDFECYDISSSSDEDSRPKKKKRKHPQNSIFDDEYDESGEQ